MNKIKDYVQLVKPSLSIMVVFSSVISYLLAPKVVEYDWVMIFLLFAGGMLVTGSANAMNQVVEKDTDAMMKRTAKRPVANGKMSVNEALTFAAVSGIIGVLIIGCWFNWTAAALGLFSLFIYGYVYTPLKKISSVSVLVGAIPGALPCLIGWVAGTDKLSAGGWALFGIQFLWQFPHFWAIAWLAYQDYARAGFKLLPSNEGPTRFSAIQSVLYSVVMIPIGVLPYYFHITGIVSLWIVIGANLFLLFQCVRLLSELNATAARRVMFSSYIYLPVVFLSLLADKV